MEIELFNYFLQLFNHLLQGPSDIGEKMGFRYFLEQTLMRKSSGNGLLVGNLELDQSKAPSSFVYDVTQSTSTVLNQLHPSRNLVEIIQLVIIQRAWPITSFFVNDVFAVCRLHD